MLPGNKKATSDPMAPRPGNWMLKTYKQIGNYANIHRPIFKESMKSKKQRKNSSRGIKSGYEPLSLLLSIIIRLSPTCNKNSTFTFLWETVVNCEIWDTKKVGQVTWNPCPTIEKAWMAPQVTLGHGKKPLIIRDPQCLYQQFKVSEILYQYFKDIYPLLMMQN